MARVGWRRLDPGRLARFGLGALAIAFGAASLAVARHDPGGSFAGSSVRDGILELAAGLSLVVAGLAFWSRRHGNRFGPLLAAAGFAWFLPEWSNPGVGASPMFTLGLVGFVACPPLVAHAALLYPRGRVGSRLERGVVAAGYAAAVGLLGILSTVVFDPAAQGCLACPANLALVDGDAGAYEDFMHWGLRAGLVATIALAAVVVWRLARFSVPAITLPVLAPAAAYLGLVAIELRHGMSAGVLGNDEPVVRLWRLEAVALLAVAAGVAWGMVRSRRARASVARLVVELAQSSEPGHARDALVRALGDPELELTYRRTASDDYIDAFGRPVLLEPPAGRAVTPLQRDGRPVAALVHDAALLGDPGLIEEVIAAARLELEHERFQADLRAQLQSLRASRARIVERGDRERRRLERDLHDGAQQRLVGLSLALRILRTRVPAPTPELERRLDEAEAELRATLAELRELAHGIFPAVLADEGLAVAVETLAETSPGRIAVHGLPEARLDGAVEAAAYFVIAETLKRGRATRATVAAARHEDALVVELEANAVPDEQLTDLKDRVGALDGTLEVVRDDGRMRVRAELPCA
jgi:signal transduction histidine kinase